MTIPTSGSFTSATVQNEWGLSLPMTSAQLGAAATLGSAYGSEQLRGRSSFSASMTSPTGWSGTGMWFIGDPWDASASAYGWVSVVGGIAPITYTWTVIPSSGPFPPVGMGASGPNCTISISGRAYMNAYGTIRCVVGQGGGRPPVTLQQSYSLTINTNH